MDVKEPSQEAEAQDHAGSDLKIVIDAEGGGDTEDGLEGEEGEEGDGDQEDPEEKIDIDRVEGEEEERREDDTNDSQASEAESESESDIQTLVDTEESSEGEFQEDEDVDEVEDDWLYHPQPELAILEHNFVYFSRQEWDDLRQDINVNYNGNLLYGMFVMYALGVLWCVHPLLGLVVGTGLLVFRFGKRLDGWYLHDARWLLSSRRLRILCGNAWPDFWRMSAIVV